MEQNLAASVPIDGVVLQPLKVIADDRGAILHMLRADSSVFRRFGEVYFSEIKPGVTKAWKRHRTITQHVAVPVGKVKFVIFDDRPGSRTYGRTAEYILGRPEAYRLLVIPPLVWYGFRGLGEEPSIIANCTDLPHDPAEAEQVQDHPALGDYAW